ncbi:mRNA interferase MazF [Sulfurivirga caldicuralii]|uniref:mRNA interferase MazF n=1 Tax=Sulfurivirga caldicuralii TaxID=364032 RepID=A0A1N6GHD5_9GAMM|nr:type II toxin-antitoxin system PemK/MazF family toxin [Sulfurivirga caldicuralii]SIO06958.1 mRNA interferase MazF [Sulfurivirga caldicuralii]
MVKRGDIISAVLPGDYGKPRPVLVVQSDLFDQHPSVTVLPITSHMVDAPLFRLSLDPERTGLNRPSQVMIDKATTIARKRLVQPIGRMPEDDMLRLNRLLAVFMGIVT